MSGAGKSVFARRLLADVSVFTLDDVHEELVAAGADSSPTVVFGELLARARVRAQASAPTVVETTGVWSPVRADVFVLAAEHERSCHMLLLDVPARVCARGRAQRRSGYHPPPDVAAEYERAWTQLLAAPEELDEEGHASVVVLDRRAANCLRTISFQ
jgi:predicted kinase